MYCMHETYIIDAGRTWTGKYLGAYKDIPISDLAGSFLQQFLNKAGLDVFRIDGCYMGIVYSAGAEQHPARQAAIKAGLGYAVDAVSLCKVCASGLAAVEYGEFKILRGKDLVIAGGMESMSRTPYLLSRERHIGIDILSKEKSNFAVTLKDYFELHEDMDAEAFLSKTKIYDSMNLDGLCDAYAEDNALMGHIAEEYVKREDISREDMDEYAYESFVRAKEYQKKIERQIVSIDGIDIDFDQGWRTPDRGKMRSLRPAFAPDGKITSANASQVSDGVSAVLLGSKKAHAYFKNRGKEALGRIRACATFSGHPNEYLSAPIYAIAEACRQAGVLVSDIDLFEVNEAFAIVPMEVMKAFCVSRDRMNIWGGAIANGHPLGASGTKILSNLAYQLQDTGARYGIAAACNGGGEAMAIVVENPSK